MIEFVKELFTARYEEGKILGCRKYSFAYWHESRHAQQMDNKLLKQCWLWLPYGTAVLGLLQLWFLYLDFRLVTLVWGGLFILPLTLFLLFIEVDANVYALYKVLKRGCFRWLVR